MKITISIFILFFSATLFLGCVQNSKEYILSAESQVKLRSFQTKIYSAKSKHNVMKGIVSVLQDLSFIVDKADYELGTISATKLDGYHLRMTITVRPQSRTKFMIRSNIQYGNKAIEDPKPYQDFYTSLDKSLFLNNNKI